MKTSFQNQLFSSGSTCCAAYALVSHGNTARFALEHGDEQLAKICGLIAADEGRHEIAYQRIIDEVGVGTLHHVISARQNTFS